MTYLRWYYAARRQGFDRNTLPYRAPLQPYLSYYGLVTVIIVLFFQQFGVFLNAGRLADGSFGASTAP